MTALTDELALGLNAPICLTWEWTYACDLACVHCLSSSGRRDPDELSTDEMKAIVDQLAEMQVFYVNIGGGEPMLRPDFFEIVEYCVGQGRGREVLHQRRAHQRRERQAPGRDGLRRHPDLPRRRRRRHQRRHPRRGHPRPGATGPWTTSATPTSASSSSSVVMTRQNVDQVDAYEALADEYGAELRLTRFRPSGRGIDTWHELHPTSEQQVRPLPLAARAPPRAHRRLVLPPLRPGRAPPRPQPLRRRSGGVPHRPRRRRLRLPVRAPRRVQGRLGARRRAASPQVWNSSDLFTSLREPSSPGACASCGSYDACGGGCMAAKFFTGLPLDAPDPECVFGHGEEALAALGADGARRTPRSAPTTPSRSASAASASPSPSCRSAGCCSWWPGPRGTDRPRRRDLRTLCWRPEPGRRPLLARPGRYLSPRVRKKSSGTTMSSADSSCDAGLAQPEQAGVDAAAQDVEDVLDAGLAVDGEAPQVGPADHHRLGPEGDGLHDVGAAPDAAVEHDLDLVAHRVDDRGQHPDRRRRAVEVVAAVVGDRQGGARRRRGRAWRRRPGTRP